jgi:hypothetical protein
VVRQYIPEFMLSDLVFLLLPIRVSRHFMELGRAKDTQNWAGEDSGSLARGVSSNCLERCLTVTVNRQ